MTVDTDRATPTARPDPGDVAPTDDTDGRGVSRSIDWRAVAIAVAADVLIAGLIVGMIVAILLFSSGASTFIYVDF